MLTAIIGKSGSGKTTLGKKLEECGENVFHIDDLVNDFYRTAEGLRVVSKFYPHCIEDSSINKKKLLVELIKPDRQDIRTLFEDELYKILVEPRMEKSKKTVYFEGVLPRFAIHFDQIIYVERSKEHRKKDLKKRGMDKSTFNKIDLLQCVFPDIKALCYVYGLRITPLLRISIGK
jgi:dephospho-CoA kinase